MALGKFYGVGLGPGDPELVTVKALNVLQNADVIFNIISQQSSRSVSAGIVDELPGINAETVELTFAMRDNRDERNEFYRRNSEIIISYLSEGRNCALVTIGDPLTYGTYGYIMKELRQMLPELEIETVPGVNSWTALAAKTNTVLVEDRGKLSIVPSFAEEDIESVMRENSDTVVFLKTYRTRDKLLSVLPDGADILYGSNICLGDEFITDSREEILQTEQNYLSMIIVRKRDES